MDLVVDANILFAALIKAGITAELICRNDFHLYAPEFLLEEFEKYKEELLGKTERIESEFTMLLNFIQRRITFVPREEIEPLLEKALMISPDIKDITYVALALKLNVAIWSNDKNLKEKQNVVQVYHTHELSLL